MGFLLEAGSFSAPILTVALLLSTGAAAQTGNPAVDPQKIVRDASWNELHS